MPIIVLNSGGFDSVTLLHLVSKRYPTENIISVFFNYNQRNLKVEQLKAQECAEKLNIKHLEINIPKFEWSNTSLYNYSECDFTQENQYLEMRNLIFISYAVSLAETFKANKIFMGILRWGTYPDTTKKFVNNTKRYLKNITNIDFETPFIELGKLEVGYIAYKLGIDLNESFSCNTPLNINDKLFPCGRCGDCEELEYVKQLYNNIHSFDNELDFYNLPIEVYTPKFKDKLKRLVKFLY